MKKIIIFFMLPLSVFSQQLEYKFFIKFTDKLNNEYKLSEAEKFLSEKSINRRVKQNISLNISDLPVTQTYVDQIKNIGFNVLAKSKWFNGIIVQTTDSSLINQVNFLFVDSLYYFGKWQISNKTHKQSSSFSRKMDYGASLNQIYMLWGDSLHHNGFKGENMLIAVLDAGFYNVDSLECFGKLNNEGRILGTYDFVEKEKDVYNDDTHGMMVMSCMASDLEGEIIGTAPKANYFLLRTEDAYSENIIEEFNWVCGAEFADSIGADIINSSLGYTVFNNTSQNHTYQDLDGKTNPSTIGATIAARKGIIVCNSAGNEGNGSWKYLGAPADADSILSVGAVDENRYIASFSSYGPTSDGRVKPSVCAQGKNTSVINSYGTVISANGTSFSSPVLAGMVACLWQAHPSKNNMEIINSIIQSATLFNNPNDHEGYGLANFYKADSLLTLTEDLIPSLNCYPNPTNSAFTIDLYSGNNTNALISIYDISGKLIYSSEEYLNRFDLNKIDIPSVDSSGVVLVTVKLNKITLNSKLEITH
ncbi:MAG: S8 family serine peptidase [Flavobacteriales bacterium]|nr:S8 family serine peptidase [Flavobacteriales bacterium]